MLAQCVLCREPYTGTKSKNTYRVPWRPKISGYEENWQASKSIVGTGHTANSVDTNRFMFYLALIKTVILCCIALKKKTFCCLFALLPGVR